MQPYDAATQHLRKAPVPSKTKEDKTTTKVKETSPVFHQFLDATYQLLVQHPTRFEFNERFLRRLLYHLYSCQYGTFLYNNEKDRLDNHVREKTRSVWDYFLSRKEQFINENYDSTIDDNVRGQERLILPIAGEVRWWHELFGRTSMEMNGPPPSQRRHVTASPRPNIDGAADPPTVLTGIEAADNAIGIGAPGKTTTEITANGAASILAAGVAALNVVGGRRSQDERTSASVLKHEMEVEMQ